eukprot:tig00020723_g13452.t1
MARSSVAASAAFLLGLVLIEIASASPIAVTPAAPGHADAYVDVETRDFIVRFRDKDAATAAGSSQDRPRGQEIAAGRDALTARLEKVLHGLPRPAQLRVKRAFSHAFPGFVASMSEEMRAAALAQPFVEDVEADRNVSLFQTTQPWVSQVEKASVDSGTWGLDRIDQRSRPLDRSFSFGDPSPVVFVVDTGVQVTHAEFQSPRGPRAFWGVDLTTPNGTAAFDCNGHGTHVAGIVAGNTYGVARRATVVAVKTMNCAGGGTLSSVVAGVDWVAAQAAALRPRTAVLQLSLGTALSSSVNAAVQRAAAWHGLLPVVAAGNSNASACATSPASVPEALTVAASTESDRRAAWSNWGPCVDLFAPGSSIRSAWIGPNNNETRVMSGTSMAAPHAAGTAALALLRDPELPWAALAELLEGAATPAAVPDDLRAGTPTSLLYVGRADGADARLAAGRSDSATESYVRANQYGEAADAHLDYYQREVAEATAIFKTHRGTCFKFKGCNWKTANGVTAAECRDRGGSSFRPTEGPAYAQACSLVAQLEKNWISAQQRLLGYENQKLAVLNNPPALQAPKVYNYGGFPSMLDEDLQLQVSPCPVAMATPAHSDPSLNPALFQAADDLVPYVYACGEEEGGAGDDAADADAGAGAAAAEGGALQLAGAEALALEAAPPSTRATCRLAINDI